MAFINLNRGRPTSSAPKTGTTQAQANLARYANDTYRNQQYAQQQVERRARPQTTYTAGGTTITSRTNSPLTGTIVKNRATGQTQTLGSIRNGVSSQNFTRTVVSSTVNGIRTIRAGVMKS